MGPHYRLVVIGWLYSFLSELPYFSTGCLFSIESKIMPQNEVAKNISITIACLMTHGCTTPYLYVPSFRQNTDGEQTPVSF